MNEQVNGKKILITGASNGIGMYLAIHVARNGGIPILVARSEGKLEVIANELKRRYGVECHWYRADLSNDDEWKDVSDQILFVHDRIDALINNAGLGVFDRFNESAWQDIDRMLEVNVKAVMRATHQLLPHFLLQKHGHIINIASQAGKMATPKSAVYSATKHAVLGFTNALRMEVQTEGVFVTSVNPGPVRTNFFNVADPSGNYAASVDRLMIDANRLARVIVDALFQPVREINLPRWMEAGSKLYNMTPATMEKLMKKQFEKK
ncbi:SDR family NAD(P)-dependent oxidoreductase [Thalassobacillus hwangdonensis]|uniref:SDR family NAD(P)-dependent oxidoreductase n=1 Tax=Thalassobacillus hwangdonensis TaxID=546108 RepID=A0ABW3KXF8_9BACI